MQLIALDLTQYIGSIVFLAFVLSALIALLFATNLMRSMH